MKKLDGLEAARVNLLKGYADITYDPDTLSSDTIAETISAAGYQAELAPEQPDFSAPETETEEVADADVSLEDVLKEAAACPVDAAEEADGEEPGFAKATPEAPPEAAEEEPTETPDIMDELPVTEDKLTVEIGEHRRKRRRCKKNTSGAAAKALRPDPQRDPGDQAPPDLVFYPHAAADLLHARDATRDQPPAARVDDGDPAPTAPSRRSCSRSRF